ncbi:uncharacterized protein [Nicotiana sylvestris]|uniref:uncharacterized protein n=1 Tax=Nicotiana sylvestris TaxID=4096 RepID=UPI00388C96F9
MRRVTIEVPADSSLLRKLGQADVWMEPLIGPIEKAKLESHSSLTLMNDIVHATLKANLIDTEMMNRISFLEKVARDSEKIARDSQLEAINWKEQFESAQIDIEDLQESKSTLEQQVRALTSGLAVVKASSSQAEKEKERLESSFSEQLSKASEENRELKALLSQKEIYDGELVQILTQAQEDLRVSADKVRALESSHASLQASYNSVLAENEELKNEIADWEKDYEILEEKSVVEQTQDFPSPVVEALVNVEADTGIPTLSSPNEPVAASQVETASVDAPAQIELVAIDAPASVPQTSQ